MTREQAPDDDLPSRFACSWLIRRFINADAHIFCVEAEHVSPVAEEFAARAFAIGSPPTGSDSDKPAFDALLDEFEFHDPALDHIAHLLRGANGKRPDRAPEYAGLLELCKGMADLHQDDLAALEHALPIYDALYAWARAAAQQMHIEAAASLHTGS